MYDAQGADEIVLLDISATVEGRKQLVDIISQSARQCFIPITVGGGIASLEDARLAFSSGADRVCVSTAAVEEIGFVRELAQTFGRANIVVCIDAKLDEKGIYRVSSHRAGNLTEMEILPWVDLVAENGAGEILLHFVDRDGMMNGYDLDLLKQVCERSPVPVMALGGVGRLKDFEDGIRIGKAASVAGASIYHFTDQSPVKVHSYLHNCGIPVCLV